MKTLLISGYGVKLKFKKGLLLVESRNSGKQEIPLHEIDQVVITTSGVSLSSKVIRALVEHGIDLVILDSRGYPVGRVYPVFINRTVDTRRAQYQSYFTHRAVHVAREIVYAKLANQALLLKKYFYYTRIDELRDGCGKISDLASKVRSMDYPLEELKKELRSTEAEAARIYWASVALLIPKELGFEGRDQDSGDPANTSLNYAYGILYGECWRALVLAGLDPYAGFLHEDRSGKPVLVFDFVEMFRFIADSVLLGLFRRGWKPVVNNGLLDYESRRRIIDSINTFMEEARTQYIDESPVNLRQVIKKTAYMLAGYLRGDSGFEGYVHRWF